MHRIKLPIVILAMALVIGFGYVIGNELDISGTWVGTTEIPDMVENDEVTLILEKENDEYSGTISDSMGMVQDAELENIEFHDNQLSFEFLSFNGYDYVRVFMTFTVEEDTMDGYWEIEDGTSSPIELKKID